MTLPEPLNSQQRKELRQRARNVRAGVQVGKHGLTEALAAQVQAQFQRCEIVKLRVLEACPHDKSEIAEALAEALDAEVADIVGSTVSLYKPLADSGADGDPQ